MLVFALRGKLSLVIGPLLPIRGGTLMLLRSVSMKVLCATFAAWLMASSSTAQQRGESVLVGQWHAQFQTPQGSGDVYIEYLSDGHFRSTIYTPTQPMTIAQSFGTYTAHRDGPDHLRVHRTVLRSLPALLCFPNGGNCQPIPAGNPEFNLQLTIQRDDSLIDDSNMTLRRESIPQQFLQEIPDRIFLHQVPIPTVQSSGTAPSRPASSNPAIPGPAHMTPRIAPGNSDTCNDLQQNRLCTVNGGTMYTDKRGCRMCAGPN